MATVNVKTSISAPSEINVPLVRADHAATANIFRVAFEVWLSITSCLLGVVMSVNCIAAIHWTFLSVAAISTIASLVLSVKFAKPR